MLRYLLSKLSPPATPAQRLAIAFGVSEQDAKVALDSLDGDERRAELLLLYAAKVAGMSDYQRSIEAISRAETATRQGDEAAARAAYAEAAALQGAWVARLGADKPRTRSVYAASVVALHYKAGDFERARQAGEEALSQSWLMGYSAERIREVLAALPPVQQTPDPSSPTVPGCT